MYTVVFEIACSNRELTKDGAASWVGVVTRTACIPFAPEKGMRFGFSDEEGTWQLECQSAYYDVYRQEFVVELEPFHAEESMSQLISDTLGSSWKIKYHIDDVQELLDNAAATSSPSPAPVAVQES